MKAIGYKQIKLEVIGSDIRETADSFWERYNRLPEYVEDDNGDVHDVNGACEFCSYVFLDDEEGIGVLDSDTDDLIYICEYCYNKEKQNPTV